MARSANFNEFEEFEEVDGNKNKSVMKKTNKSLNYINVLPNDTQKFIKNKDIWKKVSSKPNSIFNLLVSEDEIYKKRFKRIPIYLSKKITKIDYGNANDEYETGNTIYINIPVLSESYSKEFTDNIINFMRSTSKIFVGFIKNGRKMNIPGTFDHMNSFIIDKDNEKIILFEPKGQRIQFHPTILLSRVNLLDIIASDLLKNKHDPNIFNTYEFISTTESISKTKIGKFFNSLTKMPQNLDTYCQSYSLYAVLLYCLNYGNIILSTGDNIIKLFNTITQKKILAFQNFLSTQLLQPKYIEELTTTYTETTNAGNDFTLLVEAKQSKASPKNLGGGFLKKNKKTKKTLFRKKC